MREIKFRAWDEIEGKMWNPIIGRDGRLMAPNQLGGYVTYDDPQDPLMQYTGLKDKNGKEIYEGDVVEFTSWNFEKMDPVRCVVFWDQDNVSWGVSRSTKHYHHETMGSRGTIWCYFKEVIGNIYENGDLL